MKHYSVERTNPKSVWPYRIVRKRPDGSTHKLSIKFKTRDAAIAYAIKYAAIIDTFA